MAKSRAAAVKFGRNRIARKSSRKAASRGDGKRNGAAVIAEAQRRELESS